MPTLKDKKKREELRNTLYQKLGGSGLPVSDTVRSLRKVLGMDQPAFAKLTGVSLSALRRIEQEKGHYNLETLTRILDKFQLQLAVVKRDALEEQH